MLMSVQCTACSCSHANAGLEVATERSAFEYTGGCSITAASVAALGVTGALLPIPWVFPDISQLEHLRLDRTNHTHKSVHR